MNEDIQAFVDRSRARQRERVDKITDNMFKLSVETEPEWPVLLAIGLFIGGFIVPLSIGIWKWALS